LKLPEDMLEVIKDQSALILTGIIITLISGLLYTTTTTGFKSGGRYRTKQGAILIYLAAMIFLGLFTPIINELSKIIIEVVPIISIFGALIIGTNFIINQRIPTWSHTTPKTLLIYFSGAVLIAMGYLIHL
jgi:hypothetical protein